MRRTSVVMLIAAVAMILSACGSVEEADAGAGGGSESDATASASGDPVTVTDARGQAVNLGGPATAVVGLEWGVVENLVSLGIMPVGVADVEGYTAWVSAAPLDDGVTDVGTRGEPSIDTLVSLDADLVVATTDLPPNIIAQIEEFVPVLVVRGADAENPIGQMRDNLMLVAEAVGRAGDASALLEHFNAALSEGAQQIEDAGMAGEGFAMADGYLEGSTVSIRMFTDGSLVGAVGEELGLDNEWTGEGDPDYGLAQTDVEGLTQLGDLEFLYYANDTAGGDPFEEGLTGNAVWDALPFVVDDNVHRLPDGIWMFGGPLSTEQFIDATVDAVTS